MRRSLAAMALILSAGCGHAAYRPSGESPRYHGTAPFKIVATEYTVPVALGVAMQGTVGGWDDGISLKRWLKGWTRLPKSQDSDAFFVNYVLHPLAGSETHMLARNHGWTFGEAVAFDVLGSFSWEYVFENIFEPPSGRDLVVTAPAGALFGELRYQLKQAGFLPGLMDPLGTHGEPFAELVPGGFLFGIERKF